MTQSRRSSHHLVRSPIVAATVLALGFARFTYQGDGWALNMDGASIAVVALTITAAVALWRAMKSLEQLAHRVDKKNRDLGGFGWLLPLGVAFSMFHYRWSGDLVEGLHGEFAPEWSVWLGNPETGGLVVLALLAAWMTLRIHQAATILQEGNQEDM